FRLDRKLPTSLYEVVKLFGFQQFGFRIDGYPQCVSDFVFNLVLELIRSCFTQGILRNPVASHVEDAGWLRQLARKRRFNKPPGKKALNEVGGYSGTNDTEGGE